MTALPDLLSTLSELLPSRVRYVDRQRIDINVPATIARDAAPGWHLAFAWWDNDLGWELSDVCAGIWVEYALREECRARSWQAHYIPTLDGARLSVTIYPNGSATSIGAGWADVGAEAEALAAALVAALRGEK